MNARIILTYRKVHPIKMWLFFSVVHEGEGKNAVGTGGAFYTLGVKVNGI